MDRGAWWATAHGVTRVGHDLMTQREQLGSFSFSLSTQSHGKREENQCPCVPQTDTVNGRWGHWSYHSWEAELEGGSTHPSWVAHRCCQWGSQTEAAGPVPCWRNFCLLIARVHRGTAVYRLLTFNSWVSGSIKVLKLISLGAEGGFWDLLSFPFFSLYSSIEISPCTTGTE